MSDDTTPIPIDEVEIGDGLKTAPGCSAVAVVGVNRDAGEVKVYTPTGEQTVNRWFDIDTFAVHLPNNGLQTDADREAWLNDTLPTTVRGYGNQRRPLRYVLVDGTVETTVEA